MLINFVDATNDANLYTKPPPEILTTCSLQKKAIKDPNGPHVDISEYSFIAYTAYIDNIIDV